MNDIVLAIILIALGGLVALFGIWAFGVMLPVWGFIGGFFVGATAIAGLLGQGFLGTTLGIITGLVVGIVFAALSCFFWYFGVIFAAASVGALLGTGLMRAVGMDANWLVWLVAIIFGVIFAIAALAMNLPPYLIIVNTALAGSAAVVTGLLLLLGRIELADLGNGPAWAAVGNQWFWGIVWFAIGLVGIFVQMQKVDELAASLPADRWVPANA